MHHLMASPSHYHTTGAQIREGIDPCMSINRMYVLFLCSKTLKKLLGSLVCIKEISSKT